MKWILILVGVVAGLVLVIAIIGALLPKDHVATVAAQISASPTAVWTVITDPPGYPSWRADVTKVEMLPPVPTGPSWREYSRHGAITMVVDLADPPHRLIGRIADKGLPFGGRWIYTIVPQGAASEVTITEEGTVRNPIFRFVSRFVMGHTASLEAYLRALGRRFGSEPTPTVIVGAGGAHGI